MDQALIVRRWRRYGADRLYVTADSGIPLGCVDLTSGEVIVDVPSAEEHVRLAAQAYLRADVTELVLPFDADEEGNLKGAGVVVPHAWRGERPTVVPADPGGGRAVGRELTTGAGSAAGPVTAGTVPPGIGRGGSLRARLDRLAREDWRVVRDIPLGRQGTVVEHLLIGPGGIFTVTERAHVGSTVSVGRRSMRVDDRPVSYLRDARLEAGRVQSLLRAAVGSQVSVRAVLVVQGTLEMADPPEDAFVVARHAVPAVFRLQPLRLEPRRVDALTTVARRRSTWSTLY
ncbi:nuclease-related domain-containing protein [Cellulomonas hominis]